MGTDEGGETPGQKVEKGNDGGGVVDRLRRNAEEGERDFGSGLKDIENGTQVLEFRLGEDNYAIEISQVSGIVEMKNITRLPRAPNPVDGVVDLRGDITAIIDPKKLLDIDEAEESKDFILVLDRKEDKQKTGIRVDDVLQVDAYTPDQIDENSYLENLGTKGIEENMVKGIIRKATEDDVDLVVWINIDEIIEKIK